MPFQNQQELEIFINDYIIEGIQEWGDDVYLRSQDTMACYVPVDSGNLRDSGYIQELPNGVEIGYTADYASRVEFGGPSIPLKGTFEVDIQEHKRKDGTVIRAHKKTYKDSKLICFRPKIDKFTREPQICRVIKEVPEQKGQFFLTRAVQDSLPEFPIVLEKNLKKLENI